MMATNRIPTERTFGLSVGAVCVATGALSWWRSHLPAATIFVAVGTVLMGFGVVAPAILRVPNRLWWRFAQTLGWINTRVILTLFFLLVLTPVGVLMRLCGRNPLKTRAHPGTNWSTYVARRHDPRHYEHLF